MAAAIKESSPLTGIIAEECVVIDFGEHEGKSLLEVNDTHPTYYHYLVEKREKGKQKKMKKEMLKGQNLKYVKKQMN